MLRRYCEQHQPKEPPTVTLEQALSLAIDLIDSVAVRQQPAEKPVPVREWVAAMDKLAALRELVLS